MALTAADILLETLLKWGVKVVFGRPGPGISGILQALDKKKGELRFIQTRHEEAAALMACGYARFTGMLGVCLGSAGSGAIHLLNGLYDAKLDGQPVLAITGAQTQESSGTYGQFDVPLDRLLMDVSVYNSRVTIPGQVETAANLACRTAISRRGVAHLTFPSDVQIEPVRVREGSQTPKADLTSIYSERANLPFQGNLRAAAEVLNAGKKVALLVGQGAISASSEVELVAQILGAPIIKTLLGKAVLGDDNPLTTGGLGPYGTGPSYAAIQTCDTLLLVGTSFPFTQYLPPPGSVRAVQIDIDPARIGLRYPVEIGLVGDSQRTLKEMLPLLEGQQDRSFLEAAQSGMKSWWEEIEAQAAGLEPPLKPQTIAWELGNLLPEDAFLACDTGRTAVWWMRWLRARLGQKHAVSGNLGTMGASLPFAAAAQAAYPDRMCTALAGEGSFSMLMGEFATCVQHKLPVKLIILNDAAYDSLDIFNGAPVSEGGLKLQSIDFAAFAQACGASGFTINEPAQAREILSKALQTPGPVIVQANINSDEIPHLITVGKKEATSPGDPVGTPSLDNKQIDLALISEKVREMILAMTGK